MAHLSWLIDIHRLDDCALADHLHMATGASAWAETYSMHGAEELTAAAAERLDHVYC